MDDLFKWILGFVVGVSITTVMVAVADSANVGIFKEFNPATDCQEIWDIYADVVGYKVNGIHYPWLGNNYQLWSKLGFTDLEVHEFEYCINHMPWKGGS